MTRRCAARTRPEEPGGLAEGARSRCIEDGDDPFDAARLHHSARARPPAAAPAAIRLRRRSKSAAARCAARFATGLPCAASDPSSCRSLCSPPAIRPRPPARARARPPTGRATAATTRSATAPRTRSRRRTWTGSPWPGTTGTVTRRAATATSRRRWPSRSRRSSSTRRSSSARRSTASSRSTRATGRERWSYDPQIDLTGRYANQLVCRGVETWLDPTGAAGAECRRRIFTATNDGRLIALDAATGAPCADFGDGGQRGSHRRCGEHRLDRASTR